MDTIRGTPTDFHFPSLRTPDDIATMTDCSNLDKLMALILPASPWARRTQRQAVQIRGAVSKQHRTHAVGPSRSTQPPPHRGGICVLSHNCRSCFASLRRRSECIPVTSGQWSSYHQRMLLTVGRSSATLRDLEVMEHSTLPYAGVEISQINVGMGSPVGAESPGSRHSGRSNFFPPHPSTALLAWYTVAGA